jgi:hypothetical protein
MIERHRQRHQRTPAQYRAIREERSSSKRFITVSPAKNHHRSIDDPNAMLLDRVKQHRCEEHIWGQAHFREFSCRPRARSLPASTSAKLILANVDELILPSLFSKMPWKLH